MSPKPAWLQDEPEILSLLNAALDRFDRQPGETRQRRVTLAVEDHLPSLARADERADQAWALIGELQLQGVLLIRAGRRSVYDPEWQSAKLAFAPESEATLREWLGRPWTEPVMQRWRLAVQSQAARFAAGGEALLNRRIAIPGRSAPDIVAALAKLADVAGPATLRQLSAFAFWGHSKVLDERAELIQALFPHLEIRERPIVVSIHVPQSHRGVLFIENQDTYTSAVAGLGDSADGLALVYAAGFRGAAERIRSRTGALLHYTGLCADSERSAFDRWWYEDGPAPGPCWFWGDLDFAGMQILKALRVRFAGLTAWKPGYEPMIQAVKLQGGYAVATPDSPSLQVDPQITGCAFADEVLLPTIRQFGQCDQEIVSSRSAS
jgi:hypothetical protein